MSHPVIIRGFFVPQSNLILQFARTAQMRTPHSALGSDAASVGRSNAGTARVTPAAIFAMATQSEIKLGMSKL
jgi:hypothetical protein